jgi:hypothetical protein
MLALAATFGLWGVIWLLSQYALTANDALARSAPHELAFLSGTVGAAVACQLLVRRAWLLQQLAPREQKIGVFLVLLTLTLLFQAAGTALPACLANGSRAWGWIPGGVLSAIHWAALGLVVCALPLAPPARTAVLLLLGWWLPALLAGEIAGSWGERARWILDPSRYLVEPTGRAATPGASLVDMAPAAALLLAAASLPHPSRHRR